MSGEINNSAEFFERLDVSLAQNFDPEDFPLEVLATMDVHQLQENFNLDKEKGKKVYDALENVRRYIKPQKKGFAKAFQDLFSKSATRQPSFIEDFDDLSDVIWQEGDEWQMDPCSAANAGSIKFFEADFDLNPSKYSTYSNVKDWTPLMYASALGREAIVERILQEPQNLCIQNDEKQTALILAASFGHLPIIELLRNHAEKLAVSSKGFRKLIGLDLGDKHGNTALHYAVYYAQYEVVDALVKIGADTNIRNKEGITPTELAQENDVQKVCLSSLINAGGKVASNKQFQPNSSQTSSNASISSGSKSQQQYGNF